VRVAGAEERAGVIIGPVTAASWGLFAVGAYVAGRAAGRRIGEARTAVLARLLKKPSWSRWAWPAGRSGLVTAFLACYTMHGAAGSMHNGLLHRQAGPANRAKVLSVNSMMAGGAYCLGLLALGPLAEYTSTALAIVAAGAFSILGAPLYLPARRQERLYSRKTNDPSQTDAVLFVRDSA
jgi:hypothetical protein